MSCTFTPSRCHIRLGALVRNFSRMGRPDRLMPVIKSDAYGHGMTEVAHALDAAGARHFAVGTVAEGLCLRQDGLAQTILPLLGCQNDEDWQQANACGLTPLITGFEALEKAAALSSPADPWGVAIKLDTGMSRLGFSAEDIPALLERLRACPGLKPTLAVSHFPCADMPEKEDFTRRQLEKFTAMTDSLRAAYPALKRSLANSAGTMGWPESRFELCRPGFSLYGGNPFRGTAWEGRGAGLEPVMEVSAPLLQVRHLKPGEGISYGQTFIAPREMSVAEVYATNLSSVVGVNGDVKTNYWGQTVRNPVAGSGFVITEDGYILTNYHVIDGVEDLKVSFSDGTTYDAVVVGGEEDNDIAVLKIDASGLTPVVVGNSEDLKVGEQVVAIGNPLGELTFTLTAGYVSALDRNISMSDGTVINVLQTDAAINSGNSGGPLFNLYGECIGIVNAKYSNNGSSQASIEGIGFAIPINDVIDMVTDIMEHGYVTGKPFLGVQVGSVNSSAQQYGVPAGATLETVTPGFAADKGGLKEGDILTAIDDTTLTSGNDLIAALEDYKAGDTVTFRVYRNGETLSVQVTLDEKSAENSKKQEEYLAQRQEEEQEQQRQQQQQQYNNYGWPFGNLFPWGF